MDTLGLDLTNDSATLYGLLDTAKQRLGLSKCMSAFYVANLYISSDRLTFTAETWDPLRLPHQNLYHLDMFGNCSAQDCQTYRMRGFGRLVGRRVYAAFSRWSGCPSVALPDMLSLMPYSYLSWEWLWRYRASYLTQQHVTHDFNDSVVKLVGWADRLQQRHLVYQQLLGHFHEHQHTERCTAMPCIQSQGV